MLLAANFLLLLGFSLIFNEFFIKITKNMTKIRVLELFCGIGGLHWALKETGIPFEIIGALEINPTVLETYNLNFPDGNVMQRNIESLTAEEINKMEIDAIIMSPPCQPFCRTGNRQGLKDNRSNPLTKLLEILPEIKFKYIFLENVQGFEASDAHDLLLETLSMCEIKWQEFLINPINVQVPNSRLRYYLIGKHVSLTWAFDLFSGLTNQLPDNCDNIQSFYRVRIRQQERWNQHRNRKRVKSPEISLVNHECTNSSSETTQWKIEDILEDPENVGKQYQLPPEKRSKYLNAIDIVTKSSVQSCCFTKAYFHYLTGSGSILKFTSEEACSNGESEGDIEDGTKTTEKLRHFTPREVSRLLCYPEEFQLPANHSPKQCYRGLGNSVNVYVVALILALLFEHSK